MKYVCLLRKCGDILNCIKSGTITIIHDIPYMCVNITYIQDMSGIIMKDTNRNIKMPIWIEKSNISSVGPLSLFLSDEARNVRLYYL